MSTAPSQEDYLGIGLAAMPLARPRLLLDTGDISEQQISGAAAMADAVTQFAAAGFRETFLDGVTGDKLDQRILDRWNLPRLEASEAVVVLTFNRATSAAGAGSIPAGTRVATGVDVEGGRQEFVTLASVSYGALETGNKTVNAEAVAAGEAGNVAAAQITKILDTLFDTTITVTNADRAAGGSDEETDSAYRARARAYPQTLAKGTLAALEFGAKQVPGVRVATAVEDTTGLVTVYIADSSGNSNAPLVALVVTELENWRAAGSVVNVTGGVTQSVNIIIALRVSEGQASDYAAAVQAVIEDEIELLGAGETLYLSRLVTAAIDVDRSNIIDATVTSPAANVTPTNNFNLIRAGSVTVIDA